MTPAEWIYNLGIHAALPLGVLGTYVGFQGRDPDFHTALKFQHFRAPNVTPPVRLWLHGASVGEAELVNLVLEELEHCNIPTDQLVVSTQTASGLKRINHPQSFLLPHDYPELLKPLIEYLNPDHLWVMETEIWPNLFRLMQGKVSVLNARMSRESFKWYCRFKPLFSSSLGYCRRILARTESDARRFTVLAPDSTSIDVTGSLKWIRFDPDSKPSTGSSPLSFNHDRSVVVAGSTHPDEEELILDWVSEHHLLTLLAPRHLNRVSEVESLLEERDLVWKRWSMKDEWGESAPDVVLVDVFGELASLYAEADLAFVGGSWTSGIGGHNVLEPARYGVPILVGPYIDNIQDTALRLRRAGLLHRFETRREGRQLFNDFVKRGFPRPRDAVETLLYDVRTTRKNYRRALSDLLAPTGVTP